MNPVPPIGTFVKLTAITGLGSNRVSRDVYGILLSYVPEPQNMFDIIADIRLLVTNGEIVEYCVFHGDALEVVE